MRIQAYTKEKLTYHYLTFSIIYFGLLGFLFSIITIMVRERSYGKKEG
jgi:hypothetical protein